MRCSECGSSEVKVEELQLSGQSVPYCMDCYIERLRKERIRNAKRNK